MKDIGVGFKKIFREEKGFLVLMGILFVIGVVLIVHTFLHFKGGGTTMYLGYSDIGKFSGGDFYSLRNSGGYRTGGWSDILVFPILGVVLGVFHNLFAVQAFLRKGKGYAQVVVYLSMFVGVGAFIVLLRLLGEI